MSRFYLPSNASRARLKEAFDARKNRQEIVRELSWGRVSRRDLLKWGLFSGAGVLASTRGLSPFSESAFASSGSGTSTGLPPSPLFGIKPFTQPMLRFDVLKRDPLSTLTPAPTRCSNQTKQAVDPALGGGFGPIEGRPPGEMWAHQMWDKFPPKVAMQITQEGAKFNSAYNPCVDPHYNSDYL